MPKGMNVAAFRGAPPDDEVIASPELIEYLLIDPFLTPRKYYVRRLCKSVLWPT